MDIECKVVLRCRAIKMSTPAFVIRNRPRSEASAFDEADAKLNVALHRKGQRRHHVAEPVVQLCGPLVPILAEGEQWSCHRPLGFGHNYYR